jgi:hypothetical protein
MVVLTPVNTARNAAVLEHAARVGLGIDFTELAFPGPPLRVPEGCERIDLLDDISLLIPFYDAVWKLTEPLEAYLCSLPSCRIASSPTRARRGPRVDRQTSSCLPLSR